jgi:hypothetical protein
MEKVHSVEPRQYPTSFGEGDWKRAIVRWYLASRLIRYTIFRPFCERPEQVENLLWSETARERLQSPHGSTVQSRESFPSSFPGVIPTTSFLERISKVASTIQHSGCRHSLEPQTTEKPLLPSSHLDQS